MAENKTQPTENKVVPDIPVGRLQSKTKGVFTVMPIDSAEYKKEAGARKNRNRESELKALDAETRANIEAANAQGKGVMWQKPNGSSYLFTGQKPNEKTSEKKKKDEEKGVLAWCKRNWGWLLAGAVAVGVGVYFLVRNNKKKDKNKNKDKNLKTKESDTQTVESGSSNDNSPGGKGGSSNDTPGGGKGGSSNDTPGSGGGSSNNENNQVSDTAHSSANDANAQSSGSSLKDTIFANSAGFVSDDNCGVYDNGLGGDRFR